MPILIEPDNLPLIPWTSTVRMVSILKGPSGHGSQPCGDMQQGGDLFIILGNRDSCVGFPYQHYFLTVDFNLKPPRGPFAFADPWMGEV